MTRLRFLTESGIKLHGMGVGKKEEVPPLPVQAFGLKSLEYLRLLGPFLLQKCVLLLNPYFLISEGYFARVLSLGGKTLNTLGGPGVKAAARHLGQISFDLKVILLIRVLGKYPKTAQPYLMGSRFLANINPYLGTKPNQSRH